MKSLLLPALLALIFPALPANAQQVQSHPLVAITGVATVEGTTAKDFPKATPIAISNAAIYKALNVNKGAKPDYALMLDSGAHKIVLRALSLADAANFPDIVLLNLPSADPNNLDADTAIVENAANATRSAVSQTLSAGPGATGTVFAGLSGIAQITIYSPPSKGPSGPGHYPPPNIVTYKITGKGTNPTPNATNPDALIQFKITPGKPFEQK